MTNFEHSESSGSAEKQRFYTESGAGKSWVVSKILAENDMSLKEAGKLQKGETLWLMDEETKKNPFTHQNFTK